MTIYRLITSGTIEEKVYHRQVGTGVPGLSGSRVLVFGARVLVPAWGS